MSDEESPIYYLVRKPSTVPGQWDYNIAAPGDEFLNTDEWEQVDEFTSFRQAMIALGALRGMRE